MNSHAKKGEGFDKPLPIGWDCLHHAHTDKPILIYEDRHKAVDPEFGLAVLVCVGNMPFFYEYHEIERLLNIKFKQLKEPIKIADVLATQAEHFGFFIVAARLHADGVTLMFDEWDNVKVVADLGVLHHDVMHATEDARDILSAAFVEMYRQHEHLKPRRQVSIPVAQPAVMAA